MFDFRTTGLLALALTVVAGCGDTGTEPEPEDPTADVSVSVTGPQSAAPGEVFTYGLTVQNATGGAPAVDVVVTDTLPAGVSVTSISDDGTETGGVVTWPAVASLAPGATLIRTVSVLVMAEGDLRNVAAATSTTADPEPGNNNGTGAGQLVLLSVASADVLVTQQGDAVKLPGDTAGFQVTVTNVGPSTARSVDVIDIVPDGTTFSAISGNGVAAGGRIEWPTIDSLQSGESLTFTVQLVVPALGPVRAAASASAATADPFANNNNGFGAGGHNLSIGFSPVMTITGEGAGDQFGWLMDNLGDVDNDGADDWVVGAPTNDGGGSNSGRAYVYSGATGVELYRFTGNAGEQFGTAVDGAGDVNGDGTPDIIVGGPYSGSGRVAVFSGANGTVLWERAGENPGDQFGIAVGRLGDTNGDGMDDVLVTAPGHDGGAVNSGRVYVLSGVDGVTLASHNSLAPGGQFGSSVGGVGDLTGDGVPDFGVGAPFATGSGRVYVLSGVDADTVFFSIAADATGSAFGQFWLNSPGDVNGDGIPDIYAADILNDAGGSNTGRAYVYSGANGNLIHSLTGESAGDQFGIGRGMGDVDGDGVGDLFLAAWLSSEGAPAGGKAYVYSGATGQVIRNFVSTVPADNMGFDAVGLGDVTGDGKPDFIISGGISLSTPGRVYLVAGQ